MQLKGLHVIFLLSRRNHIQPSQPSITQQSLHLSSINLSFKEALPWLLITQRNKIFHLAVLRQLCPWRWLCQILRIFTQKGTQDLRWVFTRSCQVPPLPYNVRAWCLREQLQQISKNSWLLRSINNHNIHPFYMTNTLTVVSNQETISMSTNCNCPSY